MSKLPSMPFFPADFFADTAHISRAAAHAYLFLLGHAWLRDCQLPNDDVVLARLSGFRKNQWNRIKGEVLGFWDIGDDGFIRNRRLSKESQFIQQRCTLLRANGALSGRPKSLKFNGHTKPNGYWNETKSKAPTLTPIKESLNGELRQGRETAELVFVKEETEQWNAWTEFYRNSKRPSPGAISRKGTNERGWYFPNEWPPSSKPETQPEP